MSLSDTVLEEIALLERIRRILPSDKYHDIKVFEGERGGTRAVYIARWGTGDRRVAVKVDKMPESVNGALHVERGCDTRHEIDISSSLNIDEALQHYVNPVIDFFEAEGMTVSIEPWFDSAKSLRKIVEEEGPINVKDFGVIFTQVLEAARYLIKDEGLYHRDLNPSNILIRRDKKKGLEVRVTDLANACKIENATSKSRPTMGARMIASPFVSEKFTGFAGVYDERCEVYALGVNMLYALTGKKAFEFDVDTGEWTQLVEGIRPIVDAQGRIDDVAYNWCMWKAVGKIPRKARHFRDPIGWSMISAEGAISSIDKLVDWFNEAKKPTGLSRPRNVVLLYATIATLVTAFAMRDKIASFFSSKEEITAQTYPVGAEWDGQRLEVSNNLIEMDLTVFDPTYKQEFPKQKFLTVSPGQKLFPHVFARDLPRPKIDRFDYNTFTIEGKVYLEGYEGEYFNITSSPHDPTDMYDSMGYAGVAYPDFFVPKDLKDGVYIMAVELYAPDTNLKANPFRDDKSNIVFQKPGGVISRKRVPLVVGNPSKRLDIGTIRFGIPDEVNVVEVNNEPYQSSTGIPLEYSIILPEENSVNKFGPEDVRWQSYLRTPDPKGVPREDLTFYVVARNSSHEVMVCRAFPLERQRAGNSNYYSFKLGIPGREFSKKLVGYRKEFCR